MKIDKIKNYIFEIMLCLILLFTLFVPNLISKFLLAVILIVYSIITCKVLKKRNEASIYKKQVLFFMFLFAVIFLIVYYLLGLYFGFYTATFKFTAWSFVRNILPLSAIIICSEIIRTVCLAQRDKKSTWIITIAMCLIEISIYRNVYDIDNIQKLLSFLGLSIFANISSNLLYNYISIRYSAKPVIIYRMITTLYTFVIPIIPDVHAFLNAFVKMVYPYFIYVMLEQTYGKDNFIAAYKAKKKSFVFTTCTIVILLGLVMLISCKFSYGVIVVGSSSMAPTLKKGDAVVYDAFEAGVDNIEIGDIIIFDKNNVRTIHRIVDIKNIDGANRYYTKGDNNVKMDEGFVRDNKIIGKVNFKISSIGFPSIWVRDLFEKNGT